MGYVLYYDLEKLEKFKNINIVAIVVIAILAIAVLRGFLKGFSGTLMSLLFLVIIFFLTLVLTPLTSRVIAGSENVQQLYTEKSAEFLDRYMNGGQLDPGAVQINGRSLSETPFKIAAGVLGMIFGQSGDRATMLKKMVGFEIGITATVVTFIILFVGISIIRFIRGRSHEKNGVVSAVDHMLGIPIGLAKGLMIVWTILGVINMLAFMPQVSLFAKQIEDSAFLTWLNDKNLVTEGLKTAAAGLLKV